MFKKVKQFTEGVVKDVEQAARQVEAQVKGQPLQSEPPTAGNPDDGAMQRQPSTAVKHIAEGLVDESEIENWQYNRRILMQYTCEKSPQEVMTEFVHSNKFLSKWEAKSKRLLTDKVADVVAAEEMNFDLSPCSFGSQMRQKHFAHIHGLFFNTASYGCTPDIVTEGRQSLEQKMQSNNILWRFRTVPLRVRQAELALSNVIKADPDDVTFVPNANYGSNAVLKSQPWERGDIMLVFSCDYEATLNACEWLRWQKGVEIITVDMPLPASDDEIVGRVRYTLEQLKSQDRLPKLANFCHVTSKTAFIFPAKKLVSLFHKSGVSVMVDGAQAAGHIDINIGDIKADYYVGTMHKWMYTCPGVGFLVVQPLKQKLLQPLVVSYFYGKGFVKEFSYTGLMDFTGYMSAQYAIDFVKKVCGGYTQMRRYIHNLAQEVVRLLTQKWGTICIQERSEHYGAMPIIQLPLFKDNPNPGQAHAAAVMLALLEKDITTFIYVDEFYGRKMLVIRVACQIFHDLSDFDQLGDEILAVEPARFMQEALEKATCFVKQA